MTGTNERQQSETVAELTAILVRNCGLDPDLAQRMPTSTLEELGMDSLALLELQAVVTDRYRVRIPEETARQLSIAELATLVDRADGSGPAAEDGPAGSVPVAAGGPSEAGVTEPGVTEAGVTEAGVTELPGHTENSVVIAAPLPLVWQVTNDVARWTELFTEYESVQILERDGDTVRFRLAMFPDERGIVWTWVSERTVDPVRHEVHAHRVEPGPFEYMRIHWRYEEVPEGTRMTWTQDFAMRPTAPVDNAQMTERINTNSAMQLRIIRERIERLAGSRVIGARTPQAAEPGVPAGPQAAAAGGSPGGGRG